MTKPAVLVNDTKRVMPQLPITSVNVLRKSRGDADVFRLSSARPGLLIANTTAKSALGLDDTVHSRDLSQKALKSIFEASKAGKPEGDFLTDCKYKPIQYIGTRGIVPTKHMSKVPTGNRPGITNQDVITKKYENFAVYTDFPKGPGGTEPNQLWQDGTYNAMLAQVTKEREALPEHITFLSPDVNVRTREFNLAGQVGGQLFGDALHKQEIQKYFQNEADEYEISLLINADPSKQMTREEAREKLGKLNYEKAKTAYAKKTGLDERTADYMMPYDLRKMYSPYITEGERKKAEDQMKADSIKRQAELAQGGVYNPFVPLGPAYVRNPTAGVVGSGAGDGSKVDYTGLHQLSLSDLSKRPSEAYPSATQHVNRQPKDNTIKLPYSTNPIRRVPYLNPMDEANALGLFQEGTKSMIEYTQELAGKRKKKQPQKPKQP
jgi:hypothetical protein